MAQIRWVCSWQKSIWFRPTIINPSELWRKNTQIVLKAQCRHIKRFSNGRMVEVLRWLDLMGVTRRINVARSWRLYLPPRSFVKSKLPFTHMKAYNMFILRRKSAWWTDAGNRLQKLGPVKKRSGAENWRFWQYWRGCSTPSRKRLHSTITACSRVSLKLNLRAQSTCKKNCNCWKKLLYSSGSETAKWRFCNNLDG